ncbi:MAG: hypothetical protein ACYTG6_15570 [Planctomycetota bacterium]|jgi:hypothetical protein
MTGPDSPDTDPAPSDETSPLIDQRKGSDRRQRQRRSKQVPVKEDRRAVPDRRKGPRRTRSINQYDMSEDELEFVNAVGRFKEKTGKRFPTAKDILAILRDLGYEKRP